jgi:hypothetical protein
MSNANSACRFGFYMKKYDRKSIVSAPVSITCYLATLIFLPVTIFSMFFPWLLQILFFYTSNFVEGLEAVHT